MASSRAVVLALALGAACQFAPSAVATSGSDAPAIDAIDADLILDVSPADARDCGQASAPRDDFEDGLLCNGWPDATHSHSTVMERDGQLVVLPDRNDPLAIGGCITDFAVALRDHAVFVEVTAPSTKSSTWVSLKAYLLDSVGFPPLAIKQQGSAIQALKNNIVLASIAFDPGAMRWWRIRSEAGATSFETSPDGVAWNVFAVDTSEPQPDGVRLELYAGTWTNEPAPDEIRFDNLNVCAP